VAADKLIEIVFAFALRSGVEELGVGLVTRRAALVAISRTFMLIAAGNKVVISGGFQGPIEDRVYVLNGAR